MVLAAHAKLIFAADVEGVAIDRSIAEGVAVPPHGLLGDLVERHAFDAGRGAGEILGDEIRLEADGVENLRAAIGLVGGDAHLGHHLQQPLVDRLDVALDDLVFVELLREIILHRPQRLEGEIGVDRLRAVAGQAAEVMHFARFAGFDHEPDRGAQALADEVVMHRRAGEQRRHRNVVRPGAAVRQDDDVDAFAHGGLGADAERVERLLQAGGAVLGRPGAVEGARFEMAVADLGDGADLFEIRVREDRLARLQALEPRRAFEIEQVRPGPDDRDQAHDQLLADRIDRRVGDLGEVLLEISEEQLGLVGQRRDRRVVAHGADGFLALAPHRRHQDAQVFLGVAEGLLAIEQRKIRQRRLARRVRQLLEHDLRAFEPLLVGVALGQRRLELLVGNEAALVEIDEQHLARLQAPLRDDVLLRNGQHAHLGCHDDAVVAGDEIARRAQAVAVEGGADLAAVGEGDRRRAVPRLHQRGVVLVEGATLLVHERVARPGLGNHHHHRMGERVAALHQEFERIVEAGGIGLALVGDRPELVDIVAEQVGGHRRLARRHPVDVAAQRVDLAVVRDHPVGVRERPSRKGIGGEPLVHERERALEILVAQIGIIGAELVGQEHALVDDGAAGDGHRVIAGKPALLARIDRIRNRLAQDVEPPLELILGLDLLAAPDEHLQVHGLGRLHRFPQRRIVGGHLAPAQEGHALALDHLGVDVADHLPPVRIARHEERADRVFAGLGQGKTEPFRLLGEELLRDLHQNAGAVACARIGTDRAAMFEIAEDGERVLDQFMRGAALDVGDEADSAGILLERGIVKALRRRQPGVCAVGKARRRAFAARSLAPALSRAHVCRAHLRPRVSPPPKRR